MIKDTRLEALAADALIEKNNYNNAKTLRERLYHLGRLNSIIKKSKEVQKLANSVINDNQIAPDQEPLINNIPIEDQIRKG